MNNNRDNTDTNFLNTEQINNLSLLFKLKNLDKYKKFYKMYNISKNIDLNNILPDFMIHSYDKDLCEFLEELEKKDIDNYREKLINCINLNNVLSEYYIDYKVFNFFIVKENNVSLNSLLRKFSKKNKKITYNFVNTTTGRLTTQENSPNILTLPKKYRNIFTSRWKCEGSLLMIDFKSLEPRIAKKLTSDKNYKDIYEEINRLAEENLDRSVIKKAVISTLYGSHRSLDNISKEKTEHLMKICKQFFEYDELIKLSDQPCKEGYRKNYFGRPIHNEEETRTNVIVNNYLQSTAVDVALKYFCKLIDLVDYEKCKPLFIIHDAIIFDTHNSYKKELVNIIEQGYNCEKLGYFPLELTNFMETTIE